MYAVVKLNISNCFKKKKKSSPEVKINFNEPGIRLIEVIISQPS